MRKCKSIYYHNPTPDNFEKQVKRLIRMKYRCLSLSELLDWLNNSKSKKGKYAFISFDDGWRGNLALLAIVEKYNIPITIFVSVEPLISGNFWWEYVAADIGYQKMQEYKNLPYEEFCKKVDALKNRIRLERSAMTIDELAKIAKHPLVTIQSHTVTHPILTRLSDICLDNELRNAQEGLERICNNRIYAFSYPNGTLSEREVNAVSKYYKMAFTTEQKHISDNDNPLLLPRVALTGDYFRDLLKFYGIWSPIKSVITGLGCLVRNHSYFRTESVSHD